VDDDFVYEIPIATTVTRAEGRHSTKKKRNVQIIGNFIDRSFLYKTNKAQ